MLEESLQPCPVPIEKGALLGSRDTIHLGYLDILVSQLITKMEQKHGTLNSGLSNRNQKYSTDEVQDKSMG